MNLRSICLIALLVVCVSSSVFAFYGYRREAEGMGDWREQQRAMYRAYGMYGLGYGQGYRGGYGGYISEAMYDA